MTSSNHLRCGLSGESQELVFEPATALWLLSSFCRIHQRPFAAELLAKECVPPVMAAVVACLTVDAAAAVTDPSGAAKSTLTKLPQGFTNPQQLPANGLTLPLPAGMQVSAEIKQGRRTVLEYLLSPVQRVASEAGSER